MTDDGFSMYASVFWCHASWPLIEYEIAVTNSPPSPKSRHSWNESLISQCSVDIFFCNFQSTQYEDRTCCCVNFRVLDQQTFEIFEKLTCAANCSGVFCFSDMSHSIWSTKLIFDTWMFNLILTRWSLDPSIIASLKFFWL